MHENEFEKQVQKKMEELQFAPSDAIWKNVDKEINKKEKRRPVFWIFFFLGLMLIGGAAYFVLGDRRGKVEKLTKLKEDKKVEELSELKKLKGDKNLEADKDEKIKNNRDETLAKPRGNDDNQNELKSLQEVGKLNRSKGGNKVEKLNGLKKEKNLQHDKDINSIALKASKSKTFNKIGRNINAEKNELATNGSKNNNEENVAILNSTGENITTQESKKDDQGSSVSKTEIIIPENKKNVADNKTVLADSSNHKKVARNSVKSKKYSSWRIGFHFAPGISSVQRGLFKSVNDAYALNNPASGGGIPAPASSASKAETGFSSSVGISVNKTLSKRLFFSTGLNYHYYSTSISTGKFVDSGTNVYSYNNSALAMPVNGYYVSGGNKYVNHYHFLELPLLIDWQINKRDKIPFIWETGVSVSYLLNSNALHFDPVKGIYYKNNDLFNKTQLNATTSLMASFQVSNNELLVGPEIQYGLTRLLKKSTGNPEHLFYAGIKFSFILNKK